MWSMPQLTDKLPGAYYRKTVGPVRPRGRFQYQTDHCLRHNLRCELALCSLLCESVT